MSEMIKEGDIVKITWSYPGDDGYQDEVMSGTVLNMPRGEGDLIQIKTGETVYAINPYHWGLSLIEKKLDK